MNTYSAKDIEVLEGLEPVRQRPGMYIGGTDERAYHHLAAEILDNSMDEAVAGFANKITLKVLAADTIEIIDNGRGIPVDPHPKFPDKSALEVILTTLHAGGKFSGKAYETSGGLHGVGSSVVNALSSLMDVQVFKDGKHHRQTFSKGLVQGPVEILGDVKKTGTIVRFTPDTEIFGDKLYFKPMRLYRLARSKAFLYKGVKIEWECDPELITEDMKIPAKDTFFFPNGLGDFLDEALKGKDRIIPASFFGTADLADSKGRVEWAIAWPEGVEGFMNSYCNTVPTPEGGTHESGLRTVLLKGIKAFADRIGNKKAGILTADDLFGDAYVLLSIFYKDPQFQGQTKEKFSSSDASRLVENAVKDYLDHFLMADVKATTILLERLIEKAEIRQKARKIKDTARKSATKRLRLPGKLTDCTRKSREGTEIFIVEGDSAGGTAKQSRNRELQAILPLRGKILNVASATNDKILANREIMDITEALGCGMGKDFDVEKLRYDKVVIMTDADVDGAHIAALLMTFFYQKMPQLIAKGHLYIALPPLYKIATTGKTVYAMDDAEKDALLESKDFKGRKVEIGRFKGLGEMRAHQLKETTMDPKTRRMLRVVIPKRTEEDLEDAERTRRLVDELMGKKADNRFRFIQENAKFADNLDI